MLLLSSGLKSPSALSSAVVSGSSVGGADVPREPECSSLIHSQHFDQTRVSALGNIPSRPGVGVGLVYGHKHEHLEGGLTCLCEEAMVACFPLGPMLYL